MLSQFIFDLNLAFSLGAIVASSSTAHAQLISAPKRYRSAVSSGDTTPPYIPAGRKQKQLREKVGGARRKMEDLSSVSLDPSEFDLSVPLLESELPMPLLQAEMSLPLLEAEMSMPEGNIATSPEVAGDALPLSNDSNGSGAKIILASFLAGISAVVVGATVFFVRRRKQNQRDDNGRCVVVCDSNAGGEGQIQPVEDIDIEHDLEDVSII